MPRRHGIEDSQELNSPAIMRAIGVASYDGYVGHEFSPVKDVSISLEMADRLCEGRCASMHCRIVQEARNLVASDGSWQYGLCVDHR